MNICRLVKITPDGKPWGAPPNGPYYPFYLVFADGTAGQANAKTNPPAYKVGDEVGYEITGATPRGVPKLKIDRKADPAFCPNTTPQDHHPDLEAVNIQTTGKQYSGNTHPQAFLPAQQSRTAAPNQPVTASVKPVSAPDHTEAPLSRLDQYTELYVACLGAARKTCSDASFADDPETVRQIATAFWIQSIRDGVKINTDRNVPF